MAKGSRKMSNVDNTPADEVDTESVIDAAVEAVESAFEELVEEVVELSEQTKAEMAHGADTLKKYLAGN